MNRKEKRCFIWTSPQSAVIRVSPAFFKSDRTDPPLCRYERRQFVQTQQSRYERDCAILPLDSNAASLTESLAVLERNACIRDAARDSVLFVPSLEKGMRIWAAPSCKVPRSKLRETFSLASRPEKADAILVGEVPYAWTCQRQALAYSSSLGAFFLVSCLSIRLPGEKEKTDMFSVLESLAVKEGGMGNVTLGAFVRAMRVKDASFLIRASGFENEETVLQSRFVFLGTLLCAGCSDSLVIGVMNGDYPKMAVVDDYAALIDAPPSEPQVLSERNAVSLYDMLSSDSSKTVIEGMSVLSNTSYMSFPSLAKWLIRLTADRWDPLRNRLRTGAKDMLRALGLDMPLHMADDSPLRNAAPEELASIAPAVKAVLERRAEKAAEDSFLWPLGTRVNASVTLINLPPCQEH